MKMTTEVWAEFQNIGAPKDKLRVKGTAIEVLKAQLDWLSRVTMNNHFRIIVARNEAELEALLGRKQNFSGDDAKAEFLEMLEEMGLPTTDSME